MTSWTSKTLILLAATCALLGCDGEAGEYCDLFVECENGNDADYDACVTSFDAAEDTSDACDCGEDRDAFYECFFDGNDDCNNDSLGVDEKCSDELEDYNECVNDCLD